MSILLHGHHANDESCPLSFDMDTAERVLRMDQSQRQPTQGKQGPASYTIACQRMASR